MDAIKHAIAPLCSTNDSLEEASMNIYLTAMDVRPACLPFDTEGHEVMLERYRSHPKVEHDLSAIPNLKVFIGPYFDSGEVILIVSKNHLEFVEPRLRRLEELASVHGNRRSNMPELHILIGEILGYVCPSDMATLWEQKTVDDYSFVIDGRDYMPVWCIKNPEFKAAAEALLGRMNAALAPLGKHADLVVKEKSMAPNSPVEGGKRRQTRRRKTVKKSRRRMRR